MTEMKPAFRKNQRCPFCGSDDLIEVRTAASFIILCLNCSATGPMAQTLEKAWEAWNQRADS